MSGRKEGNEILPVRVTDPDPGPDPQPCLLFVAALYTSIIQERRNTADSLSAIYLAARVCVYIYIYIRVSLSIMFPLFCSCVLLYLQAYIQACHANVFRPLHPGRARKKF